MRKLLLTIVVTVTCTGILSAQSARPGQPLSIIKDRLEKTKHYGLSPVQKTVVAGNETPANRISSTTAAQPSNASKGSAAQVIIGTTTYDLQTNGSVQNRVYKSAGTVGACWTFSTDLAGSYPDRGAGYNYFDGTNWGPYPTTRIETGRHGWPSLIKLNNGSEVVISHFSDAGGFMPTALNTRPTAGTGTWTQSALSTFPTGETTFWPRTAAGGSTGNYVHMIDISVPTGNGGTLYQGLDGALNYSRSPDGGTTWDIDRILLPDATSLEYNGFRADGYAIDSRGDNVAIVSGGLTDDWALWKSTDNGTTFTRINIMDFPFTKYDDATMITDIDGDGIADTLLTTDGAYAVVIDPSGIAHCFAGAMLILDEVLLDPLGLFLSTDGLMYWNENMGSNPPVVIATAPDRDGDGVASAFANDLGGRYGNDGICSMPSAGVDGSGNIFVTYCPLMELTDSGNPSPLAFSFRNVYVMGSVDGGSTWDTPYNVSNSDFDEAVYNDVAKVVDNCVSMVWQQDGSPGYSVPPNGEHGIGQNDMVYDCIDVTTILTSVNEVLTENVSVTVFPNPAENYISLDYNVKESVKATIEIRNIMGQLVERITEQDLNSGISNVSINIETLAPGMYTVNTILDNRVYANKFLKK